MQIDPYSNEIRYSLSLMAYHLNLVRPSSVRIASHSVEIVKSVVRQLSYQPLSIFVETHEIQTALADLFGVMANVTQNRNEIADAVMMPFSLEEGLRPRGEEIVIAACYNALSYKTLLHPLAAKETISKKLRTLETNYLVIPVAGLFSPSFILWFTLAKVVERFDSALYFQLEDHAMHHMIERGPWWRLSYIVIVTGQAAS